MELNSEFDCGHEPSQPGDPERSIRGDTCRRGAEDLLSAGGVTVPIGVVASGHATRIMHCTPRRNAVVQARTPVLALRRSSRA